MGLEEVKSYLRVDGYDDDTLILSLQTGAEIYLTNAGITKDYTNDLYVLAVKLLLSHWYENRIIETSGAKFTKISFSLESIMFSIKYNQPVVVEVIV